MARAQRPTAGHWTTPLLLAALALAALGRSPALGQNDPAAGQLAAARQAHAERNYQVAIDRYRQFLSANAKHKDAPAAQLGIGACLLERPERDYAGAMLALQQAVAAPGFADRPVALYRLGAAQRGLAEQAAAQLAAKSGDAAALGAKVRAHYEHAAGRFGEAAQAFAARLAAFPAAAPTAADRAWFCRARCDQAQALLALQRPQEALAAVGPVLADAAAPTPYRAAALYYTGDARYQLGQWVLAGRALCDLAPFDQSFGLHARYLLARTHHVGGERPEAAANYTQLLAEYEQQRKAAQGVLANAQALKDNPDERLRLQALVSDTPQYLARARLHLGLLLYEEGRFAEAAERFDAVIRQPPRSDLIDQARLRLGMCQVQLRQYNEAGATLRALTEIPALADRALWWAGKAQLAAAEAAGTRIPYPVANVGIDLLRRAAELAGKQVGDTEAPSRRSEMLLDLAEAQQRAGKLPDAQATLRQIAQDKAAAAPVVELAAQRLVTVLHLAGRYVESDQAASAFEQAFPRSMLLPEVLLRAAENAYRTTVALEEQAATQPAAPPRDAGYRQAIRRYERLVNRFPEFGGIDAARHGLAAAHYRLGEYARALEHLQAIPDSARTADLAGVPLLVADCILRTLPESADDAIGAALLADEAQRAAGPLEAFTAAQPRGPQTPAALLKLGLCYQRIAAALGDPQERHKALAAARQAYDRMPQFANHALLPAAVFERAKCQAMMGDVGGAMAELGRFQHDPYQKSSVAPLALVRLAALLRSQGKPVEAAALLEKARGQHEAGLAADPERRPWLALLQYEHALALKAAGKPAEALALLAKQAAQGTVVAGQDVPDKAQQCRCESAALAVEAALAALGKPTTQPAEAAARQAQVEQARAALREAVARYQARADNLVRPDAGTAGHLRLLYDAAALGRVLARLDRPERQVEHEQRAQRLGRALASLAPAAPLAVEARYELAEMQAQRGDHDAAIETLSDALDYVTPGEPAERILVRLAASLIEKSQPERAAAALDIVRRNPRSPYLARARFLTGELAFRGRDWNKAIEQFTAFRDQGEWRNLPGVSDRALFRLGEACAQAKAWDQSRNAFEALVNRYPQSPWCESARYGVGWALQNQRQFDAAVANYREVARRNNGEVSLKAQLQMGLCLLEQKRAPEAAKLFQHLVQEHPGTPWADQARQRLAEIR